MYRDIIQYINLGGTGESGYFKRLNFPTLIMAINQETIILCVHVLCI